MAEGVVCVDGNGSFQNQTDEAATTSRSSRRASKIAESAWTELKKRKSTRGNPKPGGYSLTHANNTFSWAVLADAPELNSR